MGASKSGVWEDYHGENEGVYRRTERNYRFANL